MQPVLTIDITADSCPITFVKAKLALERLSAGEVLQVRLNGGEAVKNVPRIVHNEGHTILSLLKQDDGSYLMDVEKGSNGTR